MHETHSIAFFWVLMGLGFIIGMITIGIFEIVGTWQKRASYVNPDEKWDIFYSRSFIKKHFGQKVLIIYNYSFGVLCILFGFLGLFNGVWDLIYFFLNE